MRERLLASLLLIASSSSALASSGDTGGSWIRGAKNWVTGLWSKDAGDWLDRIGPALAEQDYQGTLVTVSGGRIETMGVFHAYDNGRERMRLVALTGLHREVIRDDQMVMCIGTGIDPVGYDSDPAGRWNPAGQFAQAGKLDSYRATLGKLGRVAAREAQVVNLQPRDSWRYGYRLWLDTRTGLPLRIALLGDDDSPMEQMAFTELSVGQKPDAADLQPSTRQGLQRVQTLGSGKQDDPGWRVDSPPPGFRLRGARRLGASVQLLYSDGLANVSVYIEPVPGNRRAQSTMQRGAVNAYSLWQGPRHVVAIGKVPAATVEYFARNARPPKGAASR